MNPLARFLDRLIDALKWPVALVALAALPWALWAVWQLAGDLYQHPRPMVPFAVGFGVYLVLWRMLQRLPIFGFFFSTLEHEITHALFAWATFHRVTSLRATWLSGGLMTYVGKGNWLITISPYFFPTVCLAILAVSIFLPADWRNWGEGLMGAAVAYHLTSTIRETHLGQSDLQRVGFLFALLFLPTANLIAFGLVISFSHGGLAGLERFAGDLVPKLLADWLAKAAELAS